MILRLLAIAIFLLSERWNLAIFLKTTPDSRNNTSKTIIGRTIVDRGIGYILGSLIKEDMTDKQVDMIAGTHHSPLTGGFTIAAGSFYALDYHKLGISILFRLDDNGQYRVYKISPFVK